MTTKIPFARPMQIIRRAPGAYNSSGIYIPGAETTITTEGSAQPFTPRDMLMLPGGGDNRERIKIYTATEVKQKAPGQSADLVVINGRTWEVDAVEDYTMPGATIPHYKVYCIIPEEAESA